MMKKVSNKLLVTTGGLLLVILGAFHATFWKLYDWDNELINLSQDNESLVQMMNICTICYLLLVGFILLICRSDIMDSRVGRLLMLSLSVFFAVRFILEFFFPGGSIWLGVVLLLLVFLFLIPTLRKDAIAK